MQKIRKICAIIALLIINFGFINITKLQCFASNFDNFEAMCTIEVNSGRILFSKNADKRLEMASTTKILPAIVAIENGGDLDKVYEIPKEAVGIEGSSIYLKKGEHLSLRELLFGLMLRSGNDAAVAIAIIVSGSVQNFVNLMNDYAVRLGLENSHFETVNGLHSENHYTSAYDMAKITAYALSNETFAEIVSTKEKVISSELDTKNKCRLLKNKNKLLNMVDGADGVKTGYTKKAGKCFVGSATRGDKKIVCVMLNSKTMFEDCAYFLEKAFKEFEMTKLFSANEPLNFDSKQKIYLKNDVVLPLSKDEINSIYGEIEIFGEFEKISENEQKVGKLNIFKQKYLIFSQDIYTIIDKDNQENLNDFKGNLKKIIQIF